MYRIHGRNGLELGSNVARIYGKKIKFIVNFLASWARKKPHRLEYAKREGKLKEARLSETAPETISSFEGLSRSIAESRDDLLSTSAILESLILPACTNFGAIPPATTNGNIILSWNLDASHFLKLSMSKFPLYIRDLRGSIPYLCLGAPILYGIGMMNAEGLCCVVNACGLTDEGEGLSAIELNNIAMERCASVGDAAEIYRQNLRKAVRSMTLGMLMNFNTIWLDTKGGLSAFEYSHNHFHEEKAGERGTMASANHHQFLDRSLTGSHDPNTQDLIAGSYSRLARMWNLLEENYGKIDMLTAKRITSDHIPDYSTLKNFGIEREWWQEMPDDSTICAHAWNLKRHLLKGEIGKAFLELSYSMTIFSFQLEPLRYKLWFTNGHPCKRQAIPYHWGNLLGTSEKASKEEFALSPPAKVVHEKRGLFRENKNPTEAWMEKMWYELIEEVERHNFK